MIKEIKKEVTEFECNLHGRCDGPICRYCEKCEHGKNLNEHCRQCSTDTAWMTEPLTEDEIARVRTALCEASLGLYRHPPNPRNYQTIALVPKFVREYDALRAGRG